MQITLKRQELGQLTSLIATAKADPNYAGSAVYTPTKENGATETLTISVVAEPEIVEQKAAEDADTSLGSVKSNEKIASTPAPGVTIV